MPQAAPNMSPAGQPPAGQPGQASPQNLTPQQLQQVQIVVKQAMSLLLQDQTAKMIVAKCQQGDPAQVVGSMVAPLMARINESAKGAGASVDMVTMMVAGVQVIGVLGEMLWHADVLKGEQDIPQFVAAAAQAAVQAHNTQVGQGGGEQQPPAQPGAPAGGGAPAQPGGMLAGGV